VRGRCGHSGIKNMRAWRRTRVCDWITCLYWSVAGYRSMDVWKGERWLSLEIVRGRDKTAFIPSIPRTAKRWSKEDSYVTDVKELWMSGLLRSRLSTCTLSRVSRCIGSSISASAAIPRDGLPQELSRSHCATQKAAIRETSLNLIFHNCTFSKEVLDTFGNDGFRGKQDVAMVRCPRNRTGRLIRFTAIIATVLVQSPGCNLIGQR